jgi:hypothetical protein
MLDTSIPLEVHAMSNVQGEKALPDSMDIMRGIETGQEIAQNQYKLKDQQLASQAKDQEAQDQATVKAWKGQHPDKSFMHPEDIQLAMTELEGKVSQHSFEQLQTYHQATQEHSDKMSADLKKKSAEQVAAELADMDHAAEHLFLPTREAYLNSLKRQGVTDPESATKEQKITAQKEMKDTAEAASVIAAQSPLKDSKGQPLFSKERLAQFKTVAESGFDSVDQHYQAADFAKRHYKESLDSRKEAADTMAKESKSSLEEAQAIAALRGPQDKSSEFEREVGAQYPKDSPEYKKWMDARLLKETHIAESDKNKDGSGFKPSDKRFFRRIAGAVELGTASLSNIVKLPIGSTDKGLFSSEHPGTTLFGSTVSALGTEMNSGETKDYLTSVAGLRRALANAESQGMMPSGALVHMMEVLEYTKGDTHIDKMRKLADARQVFEKALEPWYNDDAASPTEKAYIKKMQDNLAKVVPWTVDEMTELRQASKDPKRKHQTPQQVFDEYRNRGIKKETPTKKSEHPDDIQKLIDGAK